MEVEVKAFMTGKPVSIEAEASALAALDMMIEHAIRHLPVVDAQGRVSGVLSFDDLRAALPVPLSLRAPLAVDERRNLPDFAVGEVMTYSPVTISDDASLEDAAQRMIEGRFGCLPVVDDSGRLDGIITETDLLQALVTALWSERRSGRPPEPVDLQTALEAEQSHLKGQLSETGYLTPELAELASRRLARIEIGLARERTGEPAVCERCGASIPEARLRALPGTKLCIRCGREPESASIP